MKKILVIIAVICLLPLNVLAYNVDTSFDSENCVLTVSGTQTGHDASISLFNGDNLSGFKTGPINDGNFSVDFVLAYEDDTTIDITVSNEAGGNEIEKNNVVIPACVVTGTETNNENGNSSTTNNNSSKTNLKVSDNPSTGDNLLFYITIFGLSLIGLVGAGLYSKKKKFNK